MSAVLPSASNSHFYVLPRIPEVIAQMLSFHSHNSSPPATATNEYPPVVSHSTVRVESFVLLAASFKRTASVKGLTQTSGPFFLNKQLTASQPLSAAGHFQTELHYRYQTGQPVTRAQTVHYR